MSENLSWYASSHNAALALYIYYFITLSHPKRRSLAPSQLLKKREENETASPVSMNTIPNWLLSHPTELLYFGRRMPNAFVVQK